MLLSQLRLGNPSPYMLQCGDTVDRIKFLHPNLSSDTWDHEFDPFPPA
jgi:hypothetical protein